MQIQNSAKFETHPKNKLNVDAKNKFSGNIAPASSKRAESIISP
jgi:hypothetical protein